MHKHVLRALLSFAVGAAVLGALAYWYWPEISEPLVSAKEKTWVVTITFIVRRVQRPLWSLLIALGIIRYIGYATYGYYHRMFAHPMNSGAAWIYTLWLRSRTLVRVLSALSFAALLGVSFYLLTFWLGTIAWMWIVIEKFYFWLGDRLVDHGLYRFRLEYWLERAIHTVPFLRNITSRPRHWIAVLKKHEDSKRAEAKKKAKELRELEAQTRAERERW